MSELDLRHEPAATYQLNVLASSLGRLAVPNIDSDTKQQASDMCDQAVQSILETEKPPVPHTNEVLLHEAILFDDKLKRQMTHGIASYSLPKLTLKAALGVVGRHSESCEKLKEGAASSENLVEPAEIAHAYGLPELWEGGEEVIELETKRWEEFPEHPEIPDDLSRPVGSIGTGNLMKVMWRHVIGMTTAPEIISRLINDVENYHVYWAPLAGTLDYATPATYDKATQLSFDIPHNATHLAHLGLMQRSPGVFRYNDNMSQRAFFEAAAVYSELRAFQEASNNPEFIQEMADALDLSTLSNEELAQWIIADRGYEFKLRTARYAADIMLIDGASFEETVNEVAGRLKIPLADAEKESKKYIAWTGLGAIYTSGYRKLEATNTKCVRDLLVDSEGEVITTWHEFDRKLERQKPRAEQ